jgi:hypothetical protein
MTIGKRSSMKQAAGKILGQHWPIILLILVNLVIGLAIVRDYGLSWDEPRIYRYAKHSLDNYSNLFHGLPATDFNEVRLDLYGPAFFMAASLFSRLVTALLPSWSEINSWHLAYFLSFQIGVLSLYFLCKKWMIRWAAFGAALLFSTQPLLWGHAFINPKDMPFMSFFLASITAGLYMVDSVVPLSIGNEATRSALFAAFRKERDVSLLKAKKGAIAFLVVLILSVVGIVTGLSMRFVAVVVTYIYRMDRQSVLGAWFVKVASNADHLAVSNYIHKAQVIFTYAEIVYILLCIPIGIWLFNRVFPLIYKGLVKTYIIPYIKGVLLNPIVLAAGLVLGVTTSIRVIGPLAGGIVILYGLYKSWRKSILFIPPYFLLAGFTIYLTWPYLWGNAAHHFVESLLTMSNYPIEGVILFGGKLVDYHELPPYFLPYLMSIQLTEVVLILFVFGFIISIWRAFTQKQVEPLALIVVWFILPVVGVIANKSVVYNNFRQFLFVLPPVFLAGGLALDSLFMKVKKTFYRGAILLLFALPAVYMDVHLHPYQYVYYNSFVGGVHGAFHNYELDYWGTSYYEAAEYINRVAPPGARVVVWGPIHLFQNYARPDLRVNVFWDVNSATRYDYVVINGLKNGDQIVCKDVNAIKTIGRDGAVLTVIKIPPPEGGACP